MAGFYLVFNTVIITSFSLLLFFVDGKVIECDKNPLLKAKITDLTENKITSESTTFAEFLDRFKGKRNSNITLKIANENIRDICENSFERVSGINVLNLTSNGINTLKPGCFSGITALEIFDLSDNEVQEIKNGIFNDFQHLQEIILSNNAIAEIGSRAFGNLPVLRRICLDHNNIVILGPDWFQHSPILRRIDLSHNRIAAVGPYIFKTIRPDCYSEDQVINYTQNSQDDYFAPSKTDDNNVCPPGEKINMIESRLNINLSYNDIISVHPDALKGLVYVEFLDLSYNKLISFIGQDVDIVFGQIDLRHNLANLRRQKFPTHKIIIEKDEE